MGEGRIDEARVIRFGGFDRGRRTVVGVREGDFVEETAAVTVVFQQFVIELSPVDQTAGVRLQMLVQRAGLPFGAGILLDVQRAEACAELSEYGDGVAVSGGIDIRPVQRNQGVARIKADAHLLQPFAAEQGERRFGIVSDAPGTVFHAENRAQAVRRIAGSDVGLQFPERFPALGLACREVASGGEYRAGRGVDYEMLGRHVFHGAVYHGSEFCYGRRAGRFVGRRNVVCPVGQMDAPKACCGGADCRSRLGKQCVEFRVGHSFGEDGGVLRHDVDAHAGRRGAFAVGRVDLFERNQFARFELQQGDVVVRGAQRRRRFDDRDAAVALARSRLLVVGASAVAEERDGQQRKYPRFFHFAGG